MTLSNVYASSSLIRLAAPCILSTVLAFGCDNNGTNGNGTGATNGGGATGGNGAEPFSGAVLCTNFAVPGQGVTGLIRLVSDEELEPGEQIDSQDGAIEFGGGLQCAARGRSVFAFSWESPTVTRYDEADGVLVQGPTVSFTRFGVSSLNVGPTGAVVVSETRGYMIQAGRLLIWNPATMETVGEIPLTAADLPEDLLPGDSLLVSFDGLLLAVNSYITPQDAGAPRLDFWFVDPASDEVVAADTSEQCGDRSPYLAAASDGDVYIGPSAFNPIEHALELPGASSPCMIRIRAGTREVDPSYLADLNALTGGDPTGAPIPAGNDRVVLVAFDTNRIPIDRELSAIEHLVLANWPFYEWELGSEQPATLADDLPTGIGIIASRAFEGRPFLVLPSLDGGSALLDLTQRPLGTPTYSFTLGAPALLFRLGSELGARMAQRTEPGGGLGPPPL